MNERIRELADQAELTIRTSTGTYMSHPEFNKKFAELIVLECINQAHGVADLRGVNDDMIYGADSAAARISKHFGVE